MCGIWFCLGNVRPMYDPKLWVNRLSARGPESMEIKDLSSSTMGFTRLAINGLTKEGMQPFSRESIHWMCNGEIYNWKDIAITINQSGSDCEVLGDLYLQYQDTLQSFFKSLDGVFSIVIVDEVRGRAIVGRDPYGVRPLYIGTKNQYTIVSEGLLKFEPSHVVFSSELKALIPLCDTVTPFPPGTFQVWDLATKKMISSERYHSVPWLTNPLYTSLNPCGLDMACMSLRFALEAAVNKRMLMERPVAALLSGGIDSSLIASLVQKSLRAAGKPPLKTFSIGMKGSSDLKYAKKVADWIGSDHTEICLTADEFFKAIPDVIHAIETFDTTTVRASVGNWLVSKKIRELSNCKVVFNGDGSDEVFGSYLYFYKAPSDQAFEEEVTRLLTDIHMFDVQRSDRSISSHGLEPRTPFLDKQFVGVARSIATEWRRPIKGVQVEKWILRRAFDDGTTLPHEVLWRRKEAFSDGVSGHEKSWYEEIQERVSAYISNENFQNASLQFPHLTPKTAEQYYYRYIYEVYFGKVTTLPYFWMPNWSPEATDPSARTLGSLYETT